MSFKLSNEAKDEKFIDVRESDIHLAEVSLVETGSQLYLVNVRD